MLEEEDSACEEAFTEEDDIGSTLEELKIAPCNTSRLLVANSVEFKNDGSSVSSNMLQSGLWSRICTSQNLPASTTPLRNCTLKIRSKLCGGGFAHL